MHKSIVINYKKKKLNYNKSYIGADNKVYGNQTQNIKCGAEKFIIFSAISTLKI